MSDDRYRCDRCGISFDIVERFVGVGEVARCSEPGCGLRFQHVSRGQFPAKMRVERGGTAIAIQRDVDPHAGKWP